MISIMFVLFAWLWSIGFGGVGGMLFAYDKLFIAMVDSNI